MENYLYAGSDKAQWTKRGWDKKEQQQKIIAGSTFCFQYEKKKRKKIKKTMGCDGKTLLRENRINNEISKG